MKIRPRCRGARLTPFFCLPLLLTLVSAAFAQTPVSKAVSSPPIDFARDIQPLFKAHCYQCHAGSEQDGGLRLDTGALFRKGGASGPVVSPGKSANSLLVSRLLGLGGKPAMPMGFAPLSPTQIALIRAWIDQGAVYKDVAAKPHWAYVAPVRPPLPKVKNTGWVANPIDAFVAARLAREGMHPAAPAARVTLIRRVTLDLTGLPPTTAEVDAFLADRGPDAYAKVVDRLLQSPHFGERMALPWLDAARYADSNGFQQDGDTYQYVWRDWVVRAYNQNLPFDQFVIDQLAGDLLPNATLDNKIATGFVRCNMLNGEGGAIAEEQRNVVLFDRVDVTATAFLGATMACAQCHDHKYDPITQRDYYSWLAFFNNVPESGVPPGGGQYRIADPWVYAPSATEASQLSALDTQIAAAQATLASYPHEHATEIQTAQAEWEDSVRKSGNTAPALGPWSAAGPFPAASFDAAYDMPFAPEKQVDLAALDTSGKPVWTAHPEWADGMPHDLTGENSATYVYRVIHADSAQALPLSLGSDDAIKVWLNGALVLADKVTRGVLPDEEKPTLTLRAGDNYLLMKIVNGGGATGFYFAAKPAGLPDDIRKIVSTTAAARTPTDSQKMTDYFLRIQPPAALKADRDTLATLQKTRNDLQNMVARVMVMSDAQPRQTFILARGNYTTPTTAVTANTPACLPPLPAGAPRNRLGLARWLVSADNPLTARVQVNRYWQMLFGNGLVKTSENFGTQAEPPTYPDLLDWLAVEFRESGWDTRHILRLIVTSSTYRQSSRSTAAALRRDPENKLLARGARFRLSSLLLRDDALAASGLLNPAIGGKPVYPYQPKGIWDGLAITNERDFTYPQSKGPDLYRRSLYTFWRRTVAPANLFDTSTRTTCKVRLPITSTPLYALTTLNDITWVEAGRALAQLVLEEPGTDPNARLADAFRRVCARRPNPDEMRILRRSLDRALAVYRADPAAAKLYLTAGDSPNDPKLDPAEHAAYAAVCLAIFNLDEALTRE